MVSDSLKCYRLRPIGVDIWEISARIISLKGDKGSSAEMEVAREMTLMDDDLAARLDRLESIQEITKLKHTYWHYNDVGLLGDKIAPLFSEDGVWSNEELGHYEGREAIKTFFNGASAILPFCAHVGMNAIIDVDGDAAIGKWRCLLLGTFVEDGLGKSRLILIDYLDDFVRLDGRWLIKKLDILFNFNVEFGQSWAGSERVRATE